MPESIAPSPKPSRIQSRAFANTDARISTAAANGSHAVAAARPVRPDVVSGLPPGQYYVVAVDDLPSEGARDADVLEALAGDAVRVTLSDTAPARASLRRRAFAGSTR